MLVALVLVMLLNLATQSHNNMPPAQPTGDYLKWCHATYGPTLYPQQLQNNLFFTLEDAMPLRSDWVLEWSRPISNPGGVMQPFGMDDLEAQQPDLVVQSVLTELQDVLQTDMVDQSAATIDEENKWQNFSGKFSWSKPRGQQHNNLCMCYNKVLVQDQPYMYIRHGGYLKILVGWEEDKHIFDYGHRLVCMAFNGPPANWNLNP